MSRPRSEGAAEAVAPAERLAHALEHAGHRLPAQPPIHVFVHHNTLHAFEHLPFEEAVVEGAKLYGSEPYLSELEFAEAIATGRIQGTDLDAVLEAEAASEAPIFEGGPSVRALRRLRLGHAAEWPEGAALDWHLDEADGRRRLHPAVSELARRRLLGEAGTAAEAERLGALWAALERHALGSGARPRSLRPRDATLARTGVDVDTLVHPLLIRVCSAFVDQGVAYWSMPERARGLWPAFRALYGRPMGPPDGWLAGLAARLRDLPDDAEAVALGVLTAWGVPSSRWDELVEAELLALRGWAGMIHQLDLRPDRAPTWAPPARLIDFLALTLVLQDEALRHAAGRAEPRAQPEAEAATGPSPAGGRGLVHEAFVLAQLAGVGAVLIESGAAARAWLRTVADFTDLERRRLWHLAYERRHRIGVLDGMLAHVEAGAPEPVEPTVQAVFCIDDREESIRRHLEELRPDVETLGYAGFFGVAMRYRGLEDVHSTPLCPVVVQPKHLVVEEAIEATEAERFAAGRRRLGRVRHGTTIGSQTMVRGGLLATGLGLASMVPLVGRTLFPRAWSRMTSGPAGHDHGRPETRLRLERDPSVGPDADGLLPGYTVPEMADVVQAFLRTTGLRRLAPLVAILGHGSNSLNNPHESAHDCGATGGGRGGPNARAFSAMANHPGVRRLLAERGLEIPETTWFLGGFHDTCDDVVRWFDEDLLPEALRPALAALDASLLEARRRNAHERARRFESAALDLPPAAALAHVEARAVDLAQPRPEYGHATNAVCFVGRRSRTRGLFMDRRAFLVSYDAGTDPEGTVLSNLLQAVGPVGAGINLEYYFSRVDPVRYGCGTKLPHNIVGLLGVMDGHASDLRTGLPWQMVEVHEPVRLLTIVEAEPERIEWVASQRPDVARLVVNRWIQLVAWSPSSGRMFEFTGGGFVPYTPESRALPVVRSSAEHYRGARDHLGCARVEVAS
jgi:uncharacterized protein YbcC (UPF0753/DUF2309 family)